MNPMVEFLEAAKREKWPKRFIVKQLRLFFVDGARDDRLHDITCVLNKMSTDNTHVL